MVNTLCIVQARLTSTRLPNKVLMPLGNSGKCLLEHVYERLKMATCIDKVVFAIPGNKENEPLAKFLRDRNIPVYVEYRDENNVLMRFYNCAKVYMPKYIFRATCDNPFVDWKCAEMLYKERDNFDYLYSHSAPLGTAIEYFPMKALVEAFKNSTDKVEQEHVTPYIRKRTDVYRVGDIPYYVNVPYYRFSTYFNHWFRFNNRFFRYSGAKTTS